MKIKVKSSTDTDRDAVEFLRDQAASFVSGGYADVAKRPGYLSDALTLAKLHLEVAKLFQETEPK